MLIAENTLIEPQIEVGGNAKSYDYPEHKARAEGKARSLNYYDASWSEWIQHFDQRIEEINKENQDYGELPVSKHASNEGRLFGFEIFSKITPSYPAIFSNGDSFLQLSIQNADKTRRLVVEIDSKGKYKLIVVGHHRWHKPRIFSVENGKIEARELLRWLNSK